MKVIEISAFEKDQVHTVRDLAAAKRLRARLRENQKKVLFYTEREWKEKELNK